MIRRTMAFTIMLLTLLVVAAPAAAQGDEEAGRQKALAEALFREGRDLIDDGRIEEGCLKLEASLKAEKSLGTLLNLAICHEQLGKTARAWAEYSEVAVWAKKSGETDREAYARERSAALEPTLSRVRFVLQEPAANITILIDDEPIPSTAIGSALPLDPGKHRVTAKAPGKLAWTHPFEIDAGSGTQDLVVPKLADAPPEEIVAPLPEPTPTTETSISPLVWVGAGIAVAGLGVGIVTGALAVSKSNEVTDQCTNDICPKSLESMGDDALVLANVSNAGFVVAGVGAILGVVGLLISDFGSEDAAAQLTIDGAGASISGRF